MELGTIIMMTLMLGFVWGGFVLLLRRSMRIDAERRRDDSAS